MYDTASELNNDLGIYFYEYFDFLDAKMKIPDTKYNPINLMIDTFDYIKWF